MIKSLLSTLLFVHLLFALNVPHISIQKAQEYDKYEWVQLTGTVQYNSKKTLLLSDSSGSVTVLINRIDKEKLLEFFDSVANGDTITVIGEHYPSSYRDGRIIPFQCMKNDKILFTKRYRYLTPFPKEYKDDEFQRMLFKHRAHTRRYLQKKSTFCAAFCLAGLTAGIVGTIRISNTQNWDVLYQIPLYGAATGGFLGVGISQIGKVSKAHRRLRRIPNPLPASDKKVSLNFALRKSETTTGIFVVGTF